MRFVTPPYQTSLPVSVDHGWQNDSKTGLGMHRRTIRTKLRLTVDIQLMRCVQVDRCRCHVGDLLLLLLLFCYSLPRGLGEGTYMNIYIK